MAFRGKQLNVTTTPIQVVTETDSAGNGCSVWIAVGSNDIWVHGFSDIDTSGSKGRKVKADRDVAIDLAPGSALWIRAHSTASVCDIGIEGVD